MRFEDFQAKAVSFNPALKVSVSNKNRGGQEHWRITGGASVVSWWPYSQKQTVFCEGDNKTHRVRNAADVLKLTTLSPMSQKKPPMSQKKPPIPQKKPPIPQKKPNNGYSVPCPNCGQLMNLRTDSKFKSHGLWYACQHFPECNGCIGAHPDGKPVGIPAKKEVKRKRIDAHAIFDKLWMPDKKRRADAYRFLSTALGKPFSDCHIGMFTEEECNRTIEICNALTDTERQMVASVDISKVLHRIEKAKRDTEEAEKNFQKKSRIRVDKWRICRIIRLSWWRASRLLFGK